MADIDDLFDREYGRLVSSLGVAFDGDEAASAVLAALVDADAPWRRRSGADPATWACRTALRRLRRGRRRRTRRRIRRGHVPTALRAAVDALPDDLRVVLCLHDVGGLTVAEIAAALGMPPEAVPAAVDAARRRVRSLLNDGEGDDLTSLAPEVDVAAARSSFDRRRVRRRRYRRTLVAAAVLVVAALLTGGVGEIADIEPSEEVSTGGRRLVPVPTDDSVDPRCEELRVAPANRSIEVRAVREPTIAGERSGTPGWEVITGTHDGDPAVELEIGWFTSCRLLLIGRGVSADDLAALVAGYHLPAPDGRPMLDPRGAVWPETAQSSVPSEPPDERLSATGTAHAFARDVLGWDDVVVEMEPVAESAHDGRCDKIVYVRRASDPDRSHPIHLSLAVGRRWWSVCRLSIGIPAQAAHVAVSGTTAFAAVDAEPSGTVTADARYDYDGRLRRFAPLADAVDLGFVPDTTGSVLILFRDGAGEVIGAWGEPLAAGDTRIGDPAERAAPSGPMPIVVGSNGVLGWWDGARWRDEEATTPDLPYEPGDRFTVVGPDGVTATAVAGEPVGDEFCGVTSIVNRVAYRPSLDPPLRDERVAVRADWDLVPRPPNALDVMSEVYVAAVADVLAARGIHGVPIELTRVVRVDLDGDGTDEVLITAEHPDAHPGGGPLAGWYSTILLRQAVGGEVVTTPLLLTTFTSDNPDNYPTHASHRLTAVADLNGDGRMEIASDTGYFESSQTDVFELRPTGAGARRVLTAFCGV